MGNKMPVLFLGHGSPMNAIQDNDFTRSLKELSLKIPKPAAVLCVSAHWVTSGTYVTSDEEPEQIYDFYGFPDELYAVAYKPKGSPETASRATALLKEEKVLPTSSWGIDHGTWAVLKFIFPDCDIPVVQLSLDHGKSSEEHFNLAKKLLPLREESVLIMGSGNIVHNLSQMDYNQHFRPYPWAEKFDNEIKNALENKDFRKILAYRKIKGAEQAHPTEEHFLPLLYVVAQRETDDSLDFVYEGFQHGSISMRCLKIG